MLSDSWITKKNPKDQINKYILKEVTINRQMVFIGSQPDYDLKNGIDEYKKYLSTK